MTGGSSFHSQTNGFKITHFTHKNNIRIFTKGSAERVKEAFCVNAHFPVIHNAASFFDEQTR